MGKRAGCSPVRTSAKKVKLEGKKGAGPDGPVLRPAQCRAYMRRVLAREFRGIVDGFVESAKTGSCQHVKLVHELMKPAAKAKLQGRGRVQELLEQLEREDAGTL